MAKKKRFVFLSDEFYDAYPASEFPEIEHLTRYISRYILWLKEGDRNDDS